MLPLSLPISLLAAGGRKRALAPNLAELLEEGEEGEAGGDALSGRRSDGAALLGPERRSISSASGAAAGSEGDAGAGSPPHKLQRTTGESGWGGLAEWWAARRQAALTPLSLPFLHSRFCLPISLPAPSSCKHPTSLSFPQHSS